MNIKWVPSPCKDCPDRHVNCHSSCEAYAEYQQKHKAEKERLYKEHALDKAINQMNYDSAKRREKTPEPLRHGRTRK